MIVVAAASGANTNLLAGRWSEISKYWRRIARIGFAGSAAEVDTQATVKYGDRDIGIFYATTVGAVGCTDDDMQVISSKKLCPPNTPISVWLSANATTNPLYVVIEFQEYVKRGRRFQKGASGCGNFNVLTTAAQAVDVSLLQGKSFAVSDRDRKITRVSFTGGSAIADSAVDVAFGSEQIMHLINMNAAALAHKLTWFWHTSQIVCPANVPLNVRVSDAFPAANVLLQLDLREA